MKSFLTVAQGFHVSYEVYARWQQNENIPVTMSYKLARQRPFRNSNYPKAPSVKMLLRGNKVTIR